MGTPDLLGDGGTAEELAAWVGTALLVAPEVGQGPSRPQARHQHLPRQLSQGHQVLLPLAASSALRTSRPLCMIRCSESRASVHQSPASSSEAARRPGQPLGVRPYLSSSDPAPHCELPGGHCEELYLLVAQGVPGR